MPIHIVWDNTEQTVIRFTFDPVWTLNDALHALDDVYYPMVQTVDHPVCILLVMIETGIPHSLFSLFKHANRLILPSVGAIVVLDAPRVFRNMFQIMKFTFSQLSEKFQFANSEADAQKRIGQYLNVNG